MPRKELAAFMCPLLALLLLFAAAGPVRADSWEMPKTRSYLSTNGQYRLTVVPRQLVSQLAYFQAKLRGETLRESEAPLGRFEQLRNGKWVLLWSRPLVNEVAPVTAVVADSGRHVVTFDNWHSIGVGDHVVVIYGAEGALVRSLRLDQIVPAFFIDGFERSVSSIHWRGGEARFTGEKLELAVSEPREELRKGGSFTVRVGLADGRVGPIASEKLAELAPRMCAAHADSVRHFNERLAYERAELVYSASADKLEWGRYLHNAVERLRPREAPADSVSKTDPRADLFGEAIFELLDTGAYMDEDFLDTFREALTAPPSELPRRWFASRDQDRMVEEIKRTAKKIKPGQLADVDMRFFADDAHWPRIRAALTASGAKLAQIDPSAPIPPRIEDLTELPPEKVVDPACAAPAVDVSR